MVSDMILKYLKDKCEEQNGSSDMGCTTKDIAQKFSMQRTNASTVLNKLCEKGLIFKIKGRPVKYSVYIHEEKKNVVQNYISFDNLIGRDKSLKKCIQQAKAAILYPPMGLHTLLLGPTGVGKTMFAEIMYGFAKEKGLISKDKTFISFNCADYASNPQLLLAHLFGSKKGAFTGADKDRKGLVDMADGSILFLDEIHRLPPEGQEMLFTLIDKGIYSPLGDIEKVKSAKVLIICATTENVDSSLLTTFTRRIPMNINIPDLKERSLEERFELICDFFKTESIRVGREIVISNNTLRTLLLYNCIGNIGQLKSDIQLGCANAFLKSVVGSGSKNIEVHSTDFSNNVKHGIVLYKVYKESVDKIVKDERRLIFNSKGKKYKKKAYENNIQDNFYESIEKRIKELKDRGVEEKDINFIMSFDIKNYFNKYIGRFKQEIKKEELSKIVDKDIISIVEKFLKTASEQLNRIFQAKVFYGLCLHISASVERILNNKRIVNYNLNEIIQKYREEYSLALILTGEIEKKFNIKIPADDAGFIAMFLCSDELMEGSENKPIIVVAMHGRCTASSMSEVANKLVGGNNVFAYDMNLDKKPDDAYNELKELIIENNRGKGAILLVDMGSLGMFGELITEETGIDIRVIDMVSTLLVIECARKALTNSDISKIWEEAKQSVNYLNNYNVNFRENYTPSKDNIIITTCTTGEGSAVKLKNMIEEKINTSEKDIQVVAIPASDKKEMYNTINTLSKNKKIISVVGTINPNIYDVPFIPISELFMDRNYTRLKKIVNEIKTPEEFYDEMFEGLSEEISEIDINEFKPYCTDFLKAIKEKINKNLDIYKISGLIMHLVYAIIRLSTKESMPVCSRKKFIIENYLKDYNNLKNAVKKIENKYNIEFSEDELSYILIILFDI